MGCQLGKLAASERRGNNPTAVTDGPPPATDPRLPLTAKQKYSMLASWKGISRAMEKTGICMFVNDANSTCPSPSTGTASELFTSTLQFFAAAQCLITENWPSDADVSNNEQFNYIIIGAGTAGSILANRLSEFENKTVLVIEAGGVPPVESIIPSMSRDIPGTQNDWHYRITNKGYTNQANVDGFIFWPRGKFLGGCSSINGMVYFKGCTGDYKMWQTAAGNDDWSPEIARQYFLKAESLQNQLLLKNPAVKENYGLNGPLVINRFNSSYREVTNKVIDSWNEIGIKKQEDLNSVNLNGCGIMTATATNGVRQSTATAYLNPTRDRPNLKVVMNTLVTKILIDNITMNAYGVEVLRNDKTLTFIAKDEVIVSAGAINTPQLLMLSGIGPRAHLESKDISVLIDSSMVGQNLQDHLEIPITIFGKGPCKMNNDPTQHLNAIQYLYNRTGFMAQNRYTDVVAYYSKTNNASCPEYQNHFGVFYQNDSEYVQSVFSSQYRLNDSIVSSIVEMNKNYTLYLFRFNLMHPLSKGNISLSSNDPRDHPIIFPNYFSDRRDLDSAVKGIKMISSKITDTIYFKSIGAFLGRLKWAPCDNYELDSEDYWRCISVQVVGTCYHPMGTARIGLDITTSVVDSKLRVHGVGKLRVVDASVVPSTISGNSHGPIIMIAERAADLIKKNND